MEEHILVCLSPSTANSKIIRTAAKMAQAFGGAFTALYVETPDAGRMDEKDREQLQENIKLAQQLGAAVEVLQGDDVPFQIAEYARLSGVTKVVAGRSAAGRHRFLKKTTLTEQILMHAPDLEVHIIPGQPAEMSAWRRANASDWFAFSAADVVKSTGILVFASLVGCLFEYLGFTEANIITVYVLAVLVISTVSEKRVYSLVSALVSVAAFNFLFTEPKFTLRAYEKGYPVTFVVMFIAAFLTGSLAAKLKRNARQAARAAFRTKTLFDTNKMMQQAQSREEIFSAAARQLLRLLDRDIILYPVDRGLLGEPVFLRADGGGSIEDYVCESEKRAAAWTAVNNRRAGRGTRIFPDAKCLYLAIRIKNAVYGVAGVASGVRETDVFENDILLSILGECALALENRKNAEEKEEAAVLAKNEQLRADLLRAISHDLRTPLTSISGNASNLLSNGESFDTGTRNTLYQDIYDDAMWLIALVENLLSITRLEEGRLNFHITAELVDEVVQEALRHVNRLKSEHVITVDNEDDLLLARMDARLIVQVIINLVDNAVKYTPKGSHIEIRTKRQDDMAVISVADDGPGIPAGQKEKVFEMFYCGADRAADSRRSLGLGLALCRSIVNTHGGTIEAADNKPHGAVFTFTLPVEEVRLNG